MAEWRTWMLVVVHALLGSVGEVEANTVVVRVRNGWKAMERGWNTCGSWDHLESVKFVYTGDSGDIREINANHLVAGADEVELGAFGIVLGRQTQWSCTLNRYHRRWKPVMKAPGEDCSFMVANNRRFTVVLLGHLVARIEGERAVVLGDVGDRPVASIAPDLRGRAIVSFRDGTSVRFSSKVAPTDASNN